MLRPEPGATATIAAARQAGMEPLSLPLFRIAPVAWQAPDVARFDGLLLTSANAMRAGGSELQKLRGLPVHAVGEATAHEAREAGFVIGTVGRGGIDDLLSRLDPDLRLLHLCGEQRHEPVGHRQSIHHLPVYRAVAIEDVGDLDRIEGAVVALHSPRAGARLAELATLDGTEISTTILAAISAEAARSAGTGWEAVEVAEEPRDPALLALAARLCNKP